MDSLVIANLVPVAPDTMLQVAPAMNFHAGNFAWLALGVAVVALGIAAGAIASGYVPLEALKPVKWRGWNWDGTDADDDT